MSLRGRRHDGGGQNELIFFYTGNASATFDPTITTSQSTTIIWQPDDAPATVTTGTTHAFSYMPAIGSHRCKVTVVGGLSLVSQLNCLDDAITSIKNIEKCVNLDIISVRSNVPLVIDLAKFGSKITSYTAWFTSCFGIISQLSRIAQTLDLQTLSGLTGSIADLPASAVTCNLNKCPNITFASVAQMVNIKTFRLDDNNKNQSDVDLVIDSIYQAVVVDANHFTASTPITLSLGGSGGTINAAPSGTYQYAASPSTGLEKIYYLCHLAAHAWAITWNGGAGP